MQGIEMAIVVQQQLTSLNWRKFILEKSIASISHPGFPEEVLMANEYNFKLTVVASDLLPVVYHIWTGSSIWCEKQTLVTKLILK